LKTVPVPTYYLNTVPVPVPAPQPCFYCNNFLFKL
jgi:hypothetical protein